MSERYAGELRRELGAVGIRGPLRRRILAEVDDHFASGETSVEQFGSPQEVANGFAAELGTQGAKRAAVSAFAALGVAGAVYAAAFASQGLAGGGTLGTAEPPLGEIAAVAIVLAPQVAFAAGCLAALRAFRRRRERVLPTAELAVLNRRTGVALLAGLVTMAAFVVYAAESVVAAAWWTTLVYAGCGVSAALLVAAAAPFAAIARLRPQVAGGAGNLDVDLRVERYRGDPWRFARHVALAVLVLTTAAGVVQSDPIDGALRGLLEAVACLGGFWALGKYLGLRS